VFPAPRAGCSPGCSAEAIRSPAARAPGGAATRCPLEQAEGAELLVLARDGIPGHHGPHSLGPAGRFVVDHAPCPVLLVRPDPVTDLGG